MLSGLTELQTLKMQSFVFDFAVGQESVVSKPWGVGLQPW